MGWCSVEGLELKVKGLYLSPNDYSSVPKGAMLEADNGVIDFESILDSRRGQNFYTADLGGPPDTMFNYDDTLLVHYDTDTLAYDSDGAGTMVDYTDTYTQPDTGYKIHSVEANKNCYFTTDEGIKKLDAITSQPTDAGAPPGLDLEGDLNGVTGFLDGDQIVAYRVLWGKKDANNNLILGAPSQRLVVSNALVSPNLRNVEVTFTIPSGIDESWFFQLYRTTIFEPITVIPGNEMYLAYEGNPETADITAGTMTVIDATGDDLLGATLYTSPTQQGIENSNTPPPFAKDVALFNNMTLYANTRNKHRLLMTYLGGLANDDTITINSMVFTGKATEDILNDEFLVATAGTPAEDIEDTALSLVRVINQSPNNSTVYAYYLSGFNSLPGQIGIEERAIGGSTFYVLSSNGDSFNPTLPVSGTTVASSNDERENGIYISKGSQPESVPLYSFLFAGSANKPIRRIKELRDSTFIFKDDGIFRFTGTDYASATVSLFDGSKQLIAFDSIAVFDNQIFGFFEDGISAVSEQGVQLISKPIENEILKVSQYDNFAANTFGVGYDSDRKYCLWTVQTEDDTYPTIAYIWNAATMTWTTWSLPRSCGLISTGDNKLYMGNPVNDRIYVERKTLTYLDHADESYSITITAVNDEVLSVADATNIAIGDAISQGTKIALVVSIDSLDVTINYATLSYATGAAFVSKPFTVRASYVPQDEGNPATVKHYPEATYFFKESNFTEFEAGFSSNNATEEQFTLNPPLHNSGAFGNLNFGTFAFGGLGVFGGRFPVRTYLPLETSMANWVIPTLELSEPFTNLSFMGMNLPALPMTTKLVS